MRDLQEITQYILKSFMGGLKNKLEKQRNYILHFLDWNGAILGFEGKYRSAYVDWPDSRNEFKIIM